MEELQARTSIHDALTNVNLAEAYLKMHAYTQAVEALNDAEIHYRTAKNCIPIVSPGLIAERLGDLKARIDRVRKAIGRERRGDVMSARATVH